MENIYGFWISPESEVHIVDTDYGHKQVMEKILGKPLDDDESKDLALFDEGWIRIVNTKKTFMVNYRCLTSSKQLSAIQDIEKSLENKGYIHEQYLLDCGYDYHFYDTLKELINTIKMRSCNG